MYRKKISKKDLERLQRLRLMDDDFMTICFDNYIEGAELLLKIILDRDDLKVSEVKTQKELKNRETSTTSRSREPTKAPIRKEQDTIRPCWIPAC